MARSLSFDNQMVTEEVAMEAPQFAGSPYETPIKKRRGRPPKVPTPSSELGLRRSTRNKLKNDGHRPLPVATAQPADMQKNKKARTTPNQKRQTKEDKTHGEADLIPETPIQSMQAVGIALGIEPAKLTKEMLEAVPHKTPEKRDK